MRLSTQIKLMIEVGGVLNAFLALQNFDRGGAWIALGVGNVIALLSLARSWTRMQKWSEK